MDKENERISAIAKGIVTELCTKTASVIPMNTANGVENVTIRSVKIIVNETKNNRVNASALLLAGKTQKKEHKQEKQPIIRHDTTGPVWPLDKVIPILVNTPTNVTIEDRPESIINTLGVTRQKAIEILKTLQPCEYVHTDRERNKEPADVYSKVTTINNLEVELYIKLKVQNKVYLVVISIHEPKNKTSKNYRGRKRK